MTYSYVIVNLISGLIELYARYNLLYVFVSNPRLINKRLLYIVMSVTFIVSKSMYFIFDIPLLNLMSTCISLYLMGRSMGLIRSTSLIAMLTTTIISVSVDVITAFIVGYQNNSVFIEAEYFSVSGIVLMSLIILWISKLFRNFKHVKNDVALPGPYWITVLLFPFISIILVLILLNSQQGQNTKLIIEISIILIMNLIVFTLYDRLIYEFDIRLKDESMHQINLSYKRQLEMMKSSLNSLRAVKHDLNRHNNSIQTLMADKRYHDLDKYLQSMQKSSLIDEGVSFSGNLVIDSIVNYEVFTSNFDTSRLSINYKNVPSSVNIKDYDLTIVISNILSNSINGAMAVAGGKVEVNIEYQKGVLFIRLINDFNGVLRVVNNKLCSLSSDESHGYGISNIKAVLSKYDGSLELNYTDEIFTSEIILYEL
ncbi:sensor histidine kinase [Acidaminobacter sp. JC074]|uniref:GHKL domain-containing protein n=1 Tax=Acidaminobacter sp. JC074 TaxID=2530199 RepID=UPI001F10CB9B|nr:GHKL domain-containing protein [Acidaminobacter sp. JC074]MCH4888924.1 sensor histidine kinase [Acidaminobacter sp. JC074]